jgi:hypothetical protein
MHVDSESTDAGSSATLGELDGGTGASGNVDCVDGCCALPMLQISSDSSQSSVVLAIWREKELDDLPRVSNYRGK